MKSNMKKILLLSVFAVQAFSSTSFAATTTNDIVAGIYENQIKSSAPTSAYPCVDVSNLAIVTSLGIDLTGKTIHDKVTGLATASAVSALPTAAVIKTQAASAITDAGLATASAVSALPTAVIIPLRLTSDVDQIMDHVFGYITLSGNVKFNPSVTTAVILSSGDSSNPVRILGNTNLTSLFASSRGTAGLQVWTPAEKLTVMLRAVFGVSSATFNTWFSTYGGATGEGGFGTVSDMEDSGIILTVFMDRVLGRNVSGYNSGNATIGAFGGTGVFGRINAATGTTSMVLSNGTSGTTASALTVPATYFSNVLGNVASGTTITLNNSASNMLDLARLRALIRDVVGVK